jgi:hypothetical protein
METVQPWDVPRRGLGDVDQQGGAPGENRTPNLMVRSHALYPIELRAQFSIRVYAL